MRSLGRKGDAPNEFRAAWSVEQNPFDRGRGVWVFDLVTKRMSELDANLQQHGRTITLPSVASGYRIHQAVFVSKDRLVTAGLFPSSRLIVMDTSGKIVRPIGDTTVGDPAVPWTARAKPYYGRIAYSRLHSSVAIASEFAGRVDIYGIDGKSAKAAVVPFAFDPEFEEHPRQPGVMTHSVGRGSTRVGYLDVAVTERLIFALFSGEQRASGNVGGQEVHVFHWDGTLKARFRLQPLAISIAVNPAGTTLYAIRAGNVPAVLAFDISECCAPVSVSHDR